MQKVPFSVSWFIPIFWTTLSLSAAHGFLQWNQTGTTLTKFQQFNNKRGSPILLLESGSIAVEKGNVARRSP